MKKLTVLSSLFVVAFGLALGMTVMFNTPAKAIPLCAYQCLFEFECTTETGPLCGGDYPYYVYKNATCVGGPLNCPWPSHVWAGCSSVNPPSPCMPYLD